MQPVFIGDELTAAAYRIAGLAVEIASPAQASARFEAVRRQHPPLILISAECAQGLPAAELEAALSAFAPPVVLVPDAARRVAVPDVALQVHAALGISG